jgi:hypothetical protein
VGRNGEKRPLGIPRPKFGCSINMDLQEVGWGEGTNWIDLARDRNRWRALVNAVMNLQVALKIANFLTS